MPFTSDNANVNHYPGTSKQACEEGCERMEMPMDDGSNNTGRLTGRRFPSPPSNPVEDSD
jgi:hypothetical protein